MIVNPDTWEVGTKFICTNSNGSKIFKKGDICTIGCVKHKRGKQLYCDAIAVGISTPLSDFELYIEPKENIVTQFVPGNYKTEEGLDVVVQEVFDGILYGRVEGRYSDKWIPWDWDLEGHSYSGEYSVYSLVLPTPVLRSVVTNEPFSEGDKVYFRNLVSKNPEWFQYQLDKLKDEKK